MSDLLTFVLFIVVVGAVFYWLIRIVAGKERVWLVTVERVRAEMRVRLPDDAILPLVLVRTPPRGMGAGGISEDLLAYWVFGIDKKLGKAHLWRVWSDKVDRYKAPLSKALIEMPPVPKDGTWKVWDYSFTVKLLTDNKASVNCASARYFLPSEKIKSSKSGKTSDDVLNLIQTLNKKGVKIDSSKFLGQEKLL